MASAEDSLNPHHQLRMQTQVQSPSSDLPQYPEIIIAAIEALNEQMGSFMAAISRQMMSAHPVVPPAHTTLLAHHLNKMKQSGLLIMVKNNYTKPDPNAPPKRGRGRPPKPKDPLVPGTVVLPPRPRGCPPKSRHPFAPLAASNKSSGGSRRPRGRPKKVKTAPAPAPATATGAPRGRGRPPKAKPAVELVAV